MIRGVIMANKYYAVRKGNTIGIFNTWNECQKSISGYSGAEYKSFGSIEDAQAYINHEDSGEKHRKLAKESDIVITYVDGSYSDETKRYSFGCIILTPNGDVIEEYGFGEDPNALSIRNVAGELQGTMYAVKFAHENQYKSILIRHDYEGISKWYTGEWKAKNTIVRKYLEFMQKYRQLIQIEFEKVNAHTGDKYNEEADRLAKLALKGEKKIFKGDAWTKVEGIKHKDLLTILEILKEDESGIDVLVNEIAYGKEYKIKGPNSEKVSIKYYEEKSNLMIQGKPGNIFAALLTYITELVDIEQIPTIFNEYCKLDIKKESIKEQYKANMPNSCGKLPAKIENSLHQAVYNLNIDGDMFDATYLTFPALRGLEGFLKYILDEHNIEYTNSFDMFIKKDNNTYRLAEGYEPNFGSSNKVMYINKLYNHFHKNRHMLFHWNDPCAEIDDTRIIYSVDSAHKLIKDTLQYINEYYIIK